MAKTSKMRRSRFPLSASFRCGYPLLNRPDTLTDAGESEKDESDPPQKRGGHVTF